MQFIRKLSLPFDEKDYSIFLFGPRGTGKTSYLRSRLPHCLYFDLLDDSLFNKLLTKPHDLEHLIPPGYSDWIIIDEVQKIPRLLNEVHRLIELKKYRFILTGSSARSLRQKGVNLLAGRALRYVMHPLIEQEMGEHFSLKKALEYGLLPSAVTRTHPEKYLETYAHLYIKEEIIQEGLRHSLEKFSRFIEVASFSQGQLINYSEIGRELGIDRRMVQTYFTILEDLLLATTLYPFTKRAKRKMVTHPKFYYFDVGVFRAIRPLGPLDTVKEVEGAGLETLFLQSLRAVNDYYNLGYSIYFWRTSAHDEVDFIISGKHGLHAFEIKRSQTIDNAALKGLKKFQEDYPEAQLHLLYGGNHCEYHNSVTAHPFLEALKKLPEILLGSKPE